jgi:hypothetical protein
MTREIMTIIIILLAWVSIAVLVAVSEMRIRRVESECRRLDDEVLKAADAYFRCFK